MRKNTVEEPSKESGGEKSTQSIINFFSFYKNNNLI